jgi:hypothetical protein
MVGNVDYNWMHSFLVAFLSSIIKSRRNNYLHIFSFLGLLCGKSFKVFSVVALWQRVNQD